MEKHIYSAASNVKSIQKSCSVIQTFTIIGLIGTLLISVSYAVYAHYIPAEPKGIIPLYSVWKALWIAGSALSAASVLVNLRSSSEIHSDSRGIRIQIEHFLSSLINRLASNIFPINKHTSGVYGEDPRKEQLVLKKVLEDYLASIQQQQSTSSLQDVQELQNVACIIRSDLDALNADLNRAYGATKGE